MGVCIERGCPTVLQRGVTRCAAHRLALERNRPNLDARRLYKTARWQHLRDLVLAEEPLCPDCLLAGLVRQTEDVHHRERHGGDPDRFFDRANLQALCHAHHSRRTALGE